MGGGTITPVSEALLKILHNFYTGCLHASNKPWLINKRIIWGYILPVLISVPEQVGADPDQNPSIWQIRCELPLTKNPLSQL